MRTGSGNFLNTLQFKVTLWVGVGLLLLALVLVPYSTITAYNLASDVAEEVLNNIALEQQEYISLQLDSAMSSARTLAQALAATQSGSANESLTREQVNGLVREVMANNPDYYGVYTVWETNAFDGMDTAYANKEGYDESGRFMTYWAPTADGGIARDVVYGYETDPYYQCPVTTKTECITEPFVYTINGVDVLLPSLTVPILVDGKAVGIVGVDISANFLQEIADQISIYNGQGQLTIISNQGMIVGATNFSDDVGKPLVPGENAEGKPQLAVNADVAELILPKVKNGEDFYETIQGNTTLLVSLSIGNTVTPWSLLLTVPTRIMLQQASSTMWTMIGLGLLVFFFGLALFWFIIGRVVSNPVKTISVTLSRMAAESHGRRRRIS